MSDYENLLAHMEHHNVKQWLLDGSQLEDARTIHEAVKRMPERRLVRKLARILSNEYGN